MLYSDTYKWVNSIDECDKFYGFQTIQLTDDDINNLKSGKVLNVGIAGDEYAIGIQYVTKKGKS